MTFIDNHLIQRNDDKIKKADYVWSGRKAHSEIIKLA